MERKSFKLTIHTKKIGQDCSLTYNRDTLKLDRNKVKKGILNNFSVFHFLFPFKPLMCPFYKKRKSHV